MRCFKLHQLKRWNTQTMRCFLLSLYGGLTEGDIYEVLQSFRQWQFSNSPLLEHPKGCWLNTICWPGRVASLITNGNGKTSKVCPDQVNHRPLLAFYVQSWALAAVLCPPIRTWKSFHLVENSKSKTILIEILHFDLLPNELFKSLKRRMQKLYESPKT